MSEQQTTETTANRTAAFFEWVNSHVRWITIGIIVLTVVAVPLAASRSQEDPNFDPSGEIYDTLDLADERFQNA